MSPAQQGGTIEIEQSLDFERREWALARCSWFVQIALIVAVLLGLFGKGPISSTREAAPDGALAVEYGRFGRFGSSMRFVVEARPDSDGTIRLALGDQLVRSFRVEVVTPAPARTVVLTDGLQYEFDAAAAAGAPIVFELQPTVRWLVRGAVRSPHANARFWQFIYP